MPRKPRPGELALTLEYLDYLESLEARATDAISGVWYNRLGAARHADGQLTQWDMFRRSWGHVARYASEELTLWFQIHGRLTFTEYREQTRQSRRDEYLDYLAYAA